MLLAALRDYVPDLGVLKFEYMFAKNDLGRRWRFDYAFPESLVAVEFDGGLFVRGRHNRGRGMIADHEKFNAAAALGWRVLRTTPDGPSILWALDRIAGRE